MPLLAPKKQAGLYERFPFGLILHACTVWTMASSLTLVPSELRTSVVHSMCVMSPLRLLPLSCCREFHVKFSMANSTFHCANILLVNIFLLYIFLISSQRTVFPCLSCGVMYVEVLTLSGGQE